jgi:hypothetical protein
MFQSLWLYTHQIKLLYQTTLQDTLAKKIKPEIAK